MAKTASVIGKMSGVQSPTSMPPMPPLIPPGPRWFRAGVPHYTRLMPSIVFLAAALLAQANSGELNLSPYLLQLKGESELRHVLIDPSQISDVAFDALIDEPWAGEQWLQVQRIRVSELEPEESSLRKQRIENGWREHGGVQVQTRAGETIWVLEEEKKWADKSQTLARAAEASQEAIVEAVEIPEASSQSGPGFIRLWAPHAAILAAAVALAAGVYLVLLRPREQWSPLDSGNQAPRRR